jgi:hypothetical protein
MFSKKLLMMFWRNFLSPFVLIGTGGLAIYHLSVSGGWSASLCPLASSMC